jgi:cyclopropane-fatty-acyl-phospholipid synthase
MNASNQNIGRHLPRDTEFRVGSGGLLVRSLNRLLDRIDAGLEEGSIEGHLPDGSRRILGGRRPGHVAEMNIRSWHALRRIAWSGSIGLYEGWEKGEWDSPDPVQIFALFMQNRKTLGDSARAKGPLKLASRIFHFLRRNSRAGAQRNIEFHYDLGNDFYRAWLDDSMTYSSAIFAEPLDDAEPLEQAQARKIDALLDRLALKDGDRLLEIGCGWGSLAEQALKRGDLGYHGITLSAEQKAYADARMDGDGRAEFTLTDYRDVEGVFDAIASVEMVEAVGQEYWPAYLQSVACNLKPGGRAAIQLISIADDVFDRYASSVDFIQRYIFPGGMLLSESRFRKLAEANGLAWQDQQDFGLHYAETLKRWRARFDAAVEEGRLPSGFDEKFVRLWRYYLMYCEGGFRGGGINVAQVTLIKR